MAAGISPSARKPMKARGNLEELFIIVFTATAGHFEGGKGCITRDSSQEEALC